MNDEKIISDKIVSNNSQSSHITVLNSIKRKIYELNLLKTNIINIIIYVLVLFIILIVIIIIYIITYNKKWLSRTQSKPTLPPAYDVLKTILKSP